MRLTGLRYSVILSLQTVLIFVDLGMNMFSFIVRKNNAVMLVLFILQDLCLILALAALLLTFFSTYIFQAGLVELLYDRFRLIILICMMYFILTTILHIWTLSVKWKDPIHNSWSTGLHIFYMLQRFIAPFYYHFYKRAALRISDPKFYETEWLSSSDLQANK